MFLSIFKMLQREVLFKMYYLAGIIHKVPVLTRFQLKCKYFQIYFSFKTDGKVFKFKLVIGYSKMRSRK